MVKHKHIALQWIPGLCQIAGNTEADALAKKDAKILQTHSTETSYHSINPLAYTAVCEAV
jgi:ribonuclease HI